MLHDKHFFRASDLTPFSFKKLNHKHKKPTELSLIYQNRPRGPPTAGCKNLEFGANLDPREQHWISRRIFMIRPEKEISFSTNQEASSSSQEASSSSTVPVETAPPLHASLSSAVPAVAPPPPPDTKGRQKFTPQNHGFLEVSQSFLSRLVGGNRRTGGILDDRQRKIYSGHSPRQRIFNA